MGSRDHDGTSTPAEPPAPRRDSQIDISARSYWRAVGVVLLTLFGLWAINQARGLASMLVISLFFALALVPGVNHLHQKRGWRRGAAVGFIYLVGLLALVLLTLVLIPAIAQLASRIGDSGTQWLTSLDGWTSDTFGFHIVSAKAASDAVVTSSEFLEQWSGKLAGVAGGAVTRGVGLVFQVATIATFTFYFAADFPRLQRSFLSWFKPSTQERLGWTIDQSVTQVGGYLYSRLLLTAINGLGFFAVMVIVGVPVSLAIPLSIFGGFVSEFIPNIGTYIGATVPIALTLALQGLVPALIVLGYALVYQQIENYWLSPHISAKTMELNGGLAFGSALAGGALFGPMGAFMALPVAALIYAFVTNYRTHTYQVVYRSTYGDDEATPPENAAGA
ncbi:MAG: AI-2E family transporter [Actinomycetota bacterium]|nr:AI-2E family transporter [Actinomycetota bacterium]MDH5223337.1 AI-2E family transporter [Actinomycetota bacterium]MDH5312421.1 AI-2E family transporter [Actinomycetota bacterium]